jgi:ABC-type transport system involved in multi-copper enzyme maturation permease subunit
VEGFDSDKISVPEIKYEYTTIAEVMRAGWVDILLLFLFNILFFAIAFWRFNKYDVR